MVHYEFYKAGIGEQWKGRNRRDWRGEGSKGGRMKDSHPVRAQGSTGAEVQHSLGITQEVVGRKPKSVHCFLCIEL